MKLQVGDRDVVPMPYAEAIQPLMRLLPVTSRNIDTTIPPPGDRLLCLLL